MIGKYCDNEFEVIKLFKLEEIKEAFLTLKDSFYDKTIFEENNFNIYIEKVYKSGNIYIVRHNKKTIGLVAFYANDIIKKHAFITMIVIERELQKYGLGKRLIEIVIKDSKCAGMEKLKLCVHKENINARGFYNKLGFKETEEANENQYISIMELRE